ncbi:MAG: hypothetical protein R3A51_01110 [Nannocystaceae bacterium]|nr:hypothetical protein [Myxococcales bacterium]
MSFTTVVLIGCFLSLALGIASLIFESGYRFDLRKRPRLKIEDGRRASDRLTA